MLSIQFLDVRLISPHLECIQISAIVKLKRKFYKIIVYSWCGELLTFGTTDIGERNVFGYLKFLAFRFLGKAPTIFVYNMYDVFDSVMNLYSPDYR